MLRSLLIVATTYHSSPTCVCHDSFLCVPWLISMCVMTHFYVCHDKFVCVPWLISMCAMTHFYVCHDSSVCVPWLICMCAMTHLYMWHDHPNGDPPRSKHPVQSSHGTRMNESCLIFEWVMSHIWMSHGTHTNLSHIWMSHVTRKNALMDTSPNHNTL